MYIGQLFKSYYAMLLCNNRVKAAQEKWDKVWHYHNCKGSTREM